MLTQKEIGILEKGLEEVEEYLSIPQLLDGPGCQAHHYCLWLHKVVARLWIDTDTCKNLSTNPTEPESFLENLTEKFNREI